MPGLLSILFSLAIFIVLFWVIYQLIITAPTWNLATVKMLLIAILVIVVIFMVASFASVPLLNGLHLR